MLGALLAANPAGSSARLQLRSDDLQIRLRPASEHARIGSADIGAVEVESYAADQPTDVTFAETGVGTAGACLRAVHACLDAARKRLDLVRSPLRMGSQHFTHVIHLMLRKLWRKP